jgi:pilus assembly protein CpaB
MGRRIIAILAATVIALVGAVLVLLYARGADARAVADASPTPVYVSKALIPAGTTLKDAQRQQQLTKTQVAAQSRPAGALTVVDDTNSALVAVADIPPGQYVLSAAFGETPVGTKKLQVDAGKLAVSVQLSDPARVASFVTPGSFITLFMTYKLKQLDASETAKVFNDQDVKGTSVLLDNIKVIGMGNASLNPQPQPTQDSPQPGNAPGFIVTLEVTPEQAARLVHAVNNYTLYAGLRGAEVTVPPNLAVNDLTLVGGQNR